MNNSGLVDSLYIAVASGYGMTTWGKLVPDGSSQSYALTFSMPKAVKEGGSSWGLFAGLVLLPCFDLELGYIHFPDARIAFDSSSLFTFEHNGLTSFTSQTESFSLMGKFKILIPHTRVSVFSSLGLAELHRKDQIINQWIFSPAFGTGISYPLSDRFSTELAANFITGQGTVELSPTEHYFPFVYALFLRLAYRL